MWQGAHPGHGHGVLAVNLQRAPASSAAMNSAKASFVVSHARALPMILECWLLALRLVRGGCIAGERWRGSEQARPPIPETADAAVEENQRTLSRTRRPW